MYIDAAAIKTYSQNNPQHNLNFSGQDEAELDKKLKESGLGGGGDQDEEGGLVGKVMNAGSGAGNSEKPKV